MRFSERSLSAHHFVNRNNIEFYRKQHPVSNENDRIYYTNGEVTPNAQVIDQLEGHSIERMTIAHYAVIVNDYTMLTAFLNKEPRLLDMTCCMTKGKANLNEDRHQIQSNPGITHQLKLIF